MPSRQWVKVHAVNAWAAHHRTSHRISILLFSAQKTKKSKTACATFFEITQETPMKLKDLKTINKSRNNNMDGLSWVYRERPHLRNIQHSRRIIQTGEKSFTCDFTYPCQAWGVFGFRAFKVE